MGHTSQIKLQKILTKQKHAVQTMFNVNTETHARVLFQELNAQVLTIMQRIKTTSAVRFSTYFQPINLYMKQDFLNTILSNPMLSQIM